MLRLKFTQYADVVAPCKCLHYSCNCYQTIKWCKCRSTNKNVVILIIVIRVKFLQFLK